MSIRNKAFAALALTSLLGVTACGSTKDDHGERGDAGGDRRPPRARAAGGRDQGGPEDRLPAQADQQPVLHDLRQGRRGRRQGVKGEFKRVGPSDTAASLAGVLHQHADDAEAGRDRDLRQRRQRGRPGAGEGQGRRHQGRHVRLRHRARGSRPVHQPGRRRGPRPQPGAAARQADRPGGRRDRDPLGHAERDQPEHLDRVHEGRALQARVLEVQARQDRLRQRRRPEVLRGDPGSAAGLPGPEGHHLARPRSASPPPRATCRARRTRARSS